MKSNTQFSIRGILLFMALIAATYPVWIELYENAVTQSMLVPTPDPNAFKKMSPFTAVSFEQEVTIVRFRDKSYELLAINGVETNRLLRIAALAFGKSLAAKRFAEDLPAVLNAAGLDGTSDRVELQLRDRQTGETIVISDAPMTAENRSIVYSKRY